MYTKENAVETLQQLCQGPTGRLRAMVGAYDICMDSENHAVSFKFKATAKNKINYVKITLTSMDDYTVEFGKIAKTEYKVVETCKGIYNDMLKNLFETTTGLYLSL